MSQSKLCRLCANSCLDYRSLYDESEVYEIIVKYFDAMFLNLHSHLTAICVQCWRHISDFNHFQQDVYAAQKNLITVAVNENEVVVKSEPDVKSSFSPATNNAPPLIDSKSIKEEQDYIALPELELIDVHGVDECGASDNDMTYSEYVVSEIEERTETNKQQPINTTSLLTERKPKSFNCEVCGERQKSGRELKIHIAAWHSENIKPEVANSEYTCNECGKVSKTHNALIKHKWYHRTKRRFKCTVCDKIFITASNLRDHSVKHIGGKDIQVKRKYTCNLCGKDYFGGTDFREHIATHTGQDIYTCPHCPATFKHRSRLHFHRKKAHPKEFAEKRLMSRTAASSEIVVDYNKVVT